MKPTRRPAAVAAARTRSAFSACSCRSPCEKFSRATSIPASTIFNRVSGSREAGPIVATIFVRRMSPATVAPDVRMTARCGVLPRSCA